MKIAIVFGTRPEAIKMAPVILRLKASARHDVIVLVSGQHREMLQEALSAFGIVPDVDLQIMRPSQTLSSVTARAVTGLEGALRDLRPDLVLVHGDTTTTMAASLAAYYCKIPVGHVEAGLRTHDKYSPFPEEINRRVADAIADLLFAPTEGARTNLLREGIPDCRIAVTGNTAVDALLWMAGRVRALDWADVGLDGFRPQRASLILVTAHRRESFGPKFESLCRGIRTVAVEHPDVDVVYPVHLNPNVQAPVRKLLADVSNVHLLPPVTYPACVKLMVHSHFVLTDSGGIQEEAPSLGKPVLIMRDTTERPEGVEAGTARLVGTSEENIRSWCGQLLADPALYARMSAAANPYGDGHAAGRILTGIEAWARHEINAPGSLTLERASAPQA